MKGVRDLPVVLLECTPSKEAQKKSSASSGMVAIDVARIVVCHARA